MEDKIIHESMMKTLEYMRDRVTLGKSCSGSHCRTCYFSSRNVSANLHCYTVQKRLQEKGNRITALEVCKELLRIYDREKLNLI